MKLKKRLKVGVKLASKSANKTKRNYKLGRKAGAGKHNARGLAQSKMNRKSTSKTQKAAIMIGSVAGLNSKKNRDKVKKSAYKMTAKHKAAIAKALKGRKRK
jgi:hypothetical protein